MSRSQLGNAGRRFLSDAFIVGNARGVRHKGPDRQRDRLAERGKSSDADLQKREELIHMRLKKLGAALFVVAALSAVLAGSAFATASTTAASWYTTASGASPLSGSLSVTTALKSGTTATFSTVVSGTRVELTAGGVECIGCEISNTATGGSGTGKLRFIDVSVMEPSACTVPATITTKALTVNADYMEGTSAMIKFTPTAGETTGFATIELGTCSIATNIIPKGTVFGKAANSTGTLAANQEVVFTPGINSAAGGTLKNGTEPAELTATGIFSAAEAFGVK